MGLEAYKYEAAYGAAKWSRAASCMSLRVRHMGLTDYVDIWRAMQVFTQRRNAESEDEVWLLQHLPVYTLGLNVKPENLPQDGTVPIVKTDRGGQITYHGPGQIIAYVLLDLLRLRIGVRGLVKRLEESVIDLLEAYQINAETRIGAPGVYVNGAKVAALGLRVRKGCCYHGLALNVDMDLRPFRTIKPCGYPGLRVTQLRDLGIDDSLDCITKRLSEMLTYRLRKI